MERDEIIMIFNSLVAGEVNQITYSKGYKLFDEIYNLFTGNFNLKKEETEDNLVKVTLEEKDEKC